MVCKEEGCCVHVTKEAGFCRVHGGAKRNVAEKRRNRKNLRRNKRIHNSDGSVGVGMGLKRCSLMDQERLVDVLMHEEGFTRAAALVELQIRKQNRK